MNAGYLYLEAAFNSSTCSSKLLSFLPSRRATYGKVRDPGYNNFSFIYIYAMYTNCSDPL